MSKLEIPIGLKDTVDSANKLLSVIESLLAISDAKIKELLDNIRDTSTEQPHPETLQRLKEYNAKVAPQIKTLIAAIRVDSLTVFQQLDEYKIAEQQYDKEHIEMLVISIGVLENPLLALHEHSREEKLFDKGAATKAAREWFEQLNYFVQELDQIMKGKVSVQMDSAMTSQLAKANTRLTKFLQAMAKYQELHDQLKQDLADIEFV